MKVNLFKAISQCKLTTKAYTPIDNSDFVIISEHLPINVSNYLHNIKGMVGNYAKGNNLYKIGFFSPSNLDNTGSNLRITVAKGKTNKDYIDISKAIHFEPKDEREIHPARQIYQHVVGLFNELKSGKYLKGVNEIK